MESNSDKILRDKLKGIELPYEPKAWMEMEQMLDKKKERKGFFMWWLGAAMLFSFALLIGHTYLQHEPTTPAVTSINKSAPLDKTNNNESISSQQQLTLTAPNKILANEKVSRSAFENNNLKNNATRINHTKFVAPQNRHVKKESAKNNSSNNYKSFPVSKNSDENLAGSLVNNTGYASISSIEIIKINQLDEMKESEEIKMEKADDQDVLLPKTKKKIFQYSLGAIANITATTLGNQHPGFFYSVPSYAVGATHQFTFINRIAITNSLEFSQTSFSVNHPSAPDFGTAPDSYVSKITEIDIPIGIKVYAVAKKKFRFYLESGIINHIKVKEVLQFSSNPYGPFTANANADQLSFPTSGPGPLATDFSINKSSRYYASLYAKAGVEFLARKQWVIFAEPLFYMSLGKIGVQNKNKYNTGLGTGFRYQF